MAEANPGPEQGKPPKYEFKKSQIMYFEDPYGAVLTSEKINTTCSCCFLLVPTGEPMAPCERCGKVIYCSYQCLAQDEPYHMVECDVFSNYEGLPPEQYRLTIRVMSRSLNEKARGSETRIHFFDHQRTIHDLISHAADANEETVEGIRRRAQMMKLKLDRAYQSDVSADDLVEMMFKIRVNAHNIYESSSPRLLKLGIGLYLGASKMDHTCEMISNYVQSFNGSNLVLTAITEFSVDNSLDIKTHYVPLNLPVRRRRHELSFKYYFLCDCPRCEFESGRDEQNLPANLEEFAESPASDGWEQRARHFYEIIQAFPPRNYYRFTLAYKLQFLCSRREDRVAAVRYGIGALEGCMTFEEKKQVTYMLCQDMAKLGYNNPSHPGFPEFDRLRGEAIALLTVVFDRSHRLVKDLRRLTYRPNRRPAVAEVPEQ